MPQTIETLPEHLKRYCVVQNSTKYTARDHAAWRYIIRRAKSFFKTHAVGDYLSGLRLTGLDCDMIPSIPAIDAALQKIGWGAVAVRGFIPPWAFFEFQAKGILPIAADMRTVEHLAYTPAPDIVHEAAGHAPILPDLEYSDFLREFTNIATKAVYSKQDLRIYEAIRLLSDLKENPDSSPQAIAKAEANLDETVAANSFVSESARVARMYWWTAEYGLSGSLQQPQIYGAGLLSSVSESVSCLSPKVKKLPLSIACTDVSYDITKQQPQLFVAESMHHLLQVTRDFGATMCFAVGGISSVRHAIDAGAIASVVFEQGLSASGCPTQVELDARGDIAFIKFQGPCQLAYDGVELTDQGYRQHPEGFSSPLGRWQAFPERLPHTLTKTDLETVGIRVGHDATLTFANGFVVKGHIKQLLFQRDQLLLISWNNCRVTRGSETYFDPSWGTFDMLVATRVASVYGGPADRESFDEHELVNTASEPHRQSPYTPRELKLFSHYQNVRLSREQRNAYSLDSLIAIATAELLESEPEWLLLLELYEMKDDPLVGERWQGTKVFAELQVYLNNPKRFTDPDAAQLLQQGLALAQNQAV